MRPGVGQPFDAEGACGLSLLLAEVVFPATQGPVKPRIGIQPVPFPGRPAAKNASEGLVPGVTRTPTAHGIPRSDRESPMRRNQQFHEHRPWSWARHVRSVRRAASCEPSATRKVVSRSQPSARGPKVQAGSLRIDRPAVKAGRWQPREGCRSGGSPGSAR